MATPLAKRMNGAALAFRGYNQKNLGRTPELLEVAAYRPYVERRLEEATALCQEALGKPTDLIGRARDRVEAGCDAYAEAIALVFAAEAAQIDLLREVHGVEPQSARLAFGYSLGELTAVATSGAYALEDVMRVPLMLAEECAAMADRVRMGVLFSRRDALDEEAVTAACEDITAEGPDAVAVSAILSPNTLLLIGEGDAVERVGRLLTDRGLSVSLRMNDGVWPPLHTPLVRERHIPDRAALLIRSAQRLADPAMPICSLVTGRYEYAQNSGREVLRSWVDSPQRLWDVVEATLAADAKLVLHIGPAPNVIPATFRRLAENVVRQTLAWSVSGVGMRTMQLATRTWLAPLLPRRGSLLRAPLVEHVIVEDWLLDNAPS